MTIIKLDGPWLKGFAYDVHTVDSTYVGRDEQGHDRFENTRSEMGELVYHLKYRGDQRALRRIVDLLDRFRGIDKMDFIVPVPPSNAARRVQPVQAIAIELGARRRIPVLPGLLRKAQGGPQLKNVDDPAERYRLLKASISPDPCLDVSGRRVLLVDDLYRSGATLTAATEVLYERCHAGEVFVLTMTKTRSKR